MGKRSRKRDHLLAVWPSWYWEINNCSQLGAFACRYGSASSNLFLQENRKKPERDRSNFPNDCKPTRQHGPYVRGLPQNVDEKAAANAKVEKKALEEQFETLILSPLSKVSSAKLRVLTRVIVIDALDECDRLDHISRILGLFLRLQE